ncbi:hypothetical protein M407DRAFT_25144 [Tulasnella calospora MUT 4182]|uniref:Protein kinase domain-containing protein n=1 Tax=Tulasnella calospora MUT 4182 TaxID=1051891 RepID=A0A0C3QGN6_9AGAM|nr:hypothetical protein M407DRAFT_25144 [Tulasnella calospora MUT 4182]
MSSSTIPRHAATIAAEYSFPVGKRTWLNNIWRKLTLRPPNHSSTPKFTPVEISWTPRPSLPNAFGDPVRSRDNTATRPPSPPFIDFGPIRHSIDVTQAYDDAETQDPSRLSPDSAATLTREGHQAKPSPADVKKSPPAAISPVPYGAKGSLQVPETPTPTRFMPSPTKLLTLSPISTFNLGLPEVSDSPTAEAETEAETPCSFPSGVKDLTGQLVNVVLIAPGNNDVYRAKLVNEDRAVAIKVFRPRPSVRETDEEAAAMQDRTHLRVQREASVWHSLGHHSRVVELLGYAVVDGNPCLISPWSKNGNVYQYLKKNPDADRRTLILDVAEGLLYLHTRDPPIVHADIKGYNVLVSDSNRAMLCDFGNSVTLADDPTGLTTPNVGQGTTRWIAPEVLLGEPATAKADVYSFGILALEIMSDKLPYYKLQVHAAVILAKARGKVPSRESYPELPAMDPFWPLLMQCWDSDADARPGMDKVHSTLAMWQKLFGYKRPQRPKRNQTAF